MLTTNVNQCSILSGPELGGKFTSKSRFRWKLARLRDQTTDNAAAHYQPFLTETINLVLRK